MTIPQHPFPSPNLFSTHPGPFASVDAEHLGLARLGAQQLSARLLTELDVSPVITAVAMAETAANLMLRCGGEFAVWQLVVSLLLSLEDEPEN